MTGYRPPEGFVVMDAMPSARNRCSIERERRIRELTEFARSGTHVIGRECRDVDERDRMVHRYRDAVRHCDELTGIEVHARGMWVYIANTNAVRGNA